ncbi:DUF2516 domain-containing protein [Streptacidiphilus pinicola]|uniref:DUF2516 domain-containing protein n=1 Tax=Streptacidiphilus pinicola TaxID=2219663 RepID=A0A2X0K0V2_9ACTN|nr:DUF2516 family protein [Streptacidiphilus pinicola]RAG81139.1 DUF2516 domain-containing protein [Streptacidiphilus pinicola]
MNHLAVSGTLTDAFGTLLGWVMLALLAFKVYTLIDAAFRREDAYRAADKQTKPFWLIILAVGAAVSFVPGMGLFLGLLGLVASIVYMVDVRPAIKRVTPRKGQKKHDHMGPYGPW